jgi:hypothetical protein
MEVDKVTVQFVTRPPFMFATSLFTNNVMFLQVLRPVTTVDDDALSLYGGWVRVGVDAAAAVADGFLGNTRAIVVVVVIDAMVGIIATTTVDEIDTVRRAHSCC